MKTNKDHELCDAVLISGYDSDKRLVFESKLSSPSCFDEECEFDDPKFLKKKKISIIVVKIYSPWGSIEEHLERHFDKNGNIVKFVKHSDDGSTETLKVSENNQKVILLALDINLDQKIKKEYPAHYFYENFHDIDVFKNKENRKKHGIRKIIAFYFLPTGEFAEENEYIFSKDGNFLKGFNKGVNGHCIEINPEHIPNDY